MGKYKLKLRPIALWVAICFLLSNVITMGVINQAAAAEQTALYSAGEMAGKAVKFINHKYKSGERIDGYTAYVLTLAGEDLAGEKWTNNGKTLKSEIENLADQLGDSNSLISYIIATQNTDGSFGPYANEYGTKVPLQALAMVKNDLTVGTDVYGQVHEAITKAVNYYKNKYRNGSMAYNVNGWDFDYRCVEALVAAGEDISTGEWVYNGTSLKDVIITSANAAADNAADLDAVRLAKELIALNAVDPYSVHIDTLAAAIRSKASTVADQVYFGNNIYDHVTVLTALGKTGKLAGIDQAKALEYLNNFKHAHSNSWGSPAGTAWGGFSPEEADLTAQVITALSYFDGADTPDSPVYSAIQDGLTYLMDIQDADTAAIPSQWDNTFSTAETLIALKSLGKTYNDYAGNDSLWIKKSRTKTIAQCLLAVNMWKDSARRDRLANLLINRQRAEEPGKGSFDNSVYSDMWAYIALGEAGKINSGSFHTENAKAYILSKQSVEQDVYGSWGEKFGDTYYPDVLSTAQAIRALTYLPDAAVDAGIQAAVDRGVAYLKGLQQDDGGVYAPPWDDPAVDNAELVITLHKLGEDPESSEWTRTVNGKRVNPGSYLMTKTMNEDGSFGTSKNIFGAAEALYAYILQTDADIIAAVKNGVKYLNDQYISDNTNHMYKQYGGYKASKVLSLAGENLAADKWKKDGKTLEARLREDAAALTEQSDVADIAKALIGLCGFKSQNISECSRLIGLLAARQKEAGNFADGTIYNEMLPYLAISMADGWNSLSAEKQARAREWLINAQTKAGPEKGSWQHQWGVDTVSTAQAIYVLSGFADAKTAGSATYQSIQDGLAWLKSKQDETGKINVQYDDPVVDTGEAVLAVLAAGQNPKGAEWTKGDSNLIDYLLLRTNQNNDGSIGDQANYSGNVGSTVPALLALLEYNKAFGWIDFGSAAGTDNSGNNSSNPSSPDSKNEYSVSIAVVGKNGERLFGPGSVKVSKNGRWGLTALGALHATGLSYTDDNGFVKSIAGQANSGMNGWMYKVNNSVPGVRACDKTVSEGDRVIWWYSTDMNSSGPSWDSLLNSSATAQTQNSFTVAKLSGEVQAALDKLAETLGLKQDTGELGPLGEAAKAVVVVNSDKPISLAEIIALKKRLAQNTVELSKKAVANQETTITDTLGEVGMSVPAKALNSNTEITVKKIAIPGAAKSSGSEAPAPKGYRPVSPVYRFGPDGTTFAVPVTLALKVAVPPLTKPENLALAWYDKVNGAWVAIPAVVDAANGLVVAKIRHFSDYAVFAKETKRSFADVTSTSYDWARHSIETLAGAGIVNGVDKVRFAPARPITRAELVSLLVKALALPKKTEDKAVFKDVPAGAWYAQDIAAAVRAGLIKGFGDGTCRPDRPVTREELAAILAQALNLQTSGKELHFNDQRDISSWAKTGVAAAAAHGLVKGFPNGAFRPAAPASRAECAVMIYRMLESV
ncbi:S-layer homology domain-containing protein [Thermincola potens]|uniref:S-layer domain protein n=1 Tax=Thermincola potens (strain JR) TaxID=635013 RepID=D5XEP6_THEPJ|nr:S-layer homology domain-containing protein [Thermincola potens]ADG82117.1 S-layer domain protein [Thermincola potens JR]